MMLVLARFSVVAEAWLGSSFQGTRPSASAWWIAGTGPLQCCPQLTRGSGCPAGIWVELRALESGYPMPTLYCIPGGQAQVFNSDLLSIAAQHTCRCRAGGCLAPAWNSNHLFLGPSDNPPCACCHRSLCTPPPSLMQTLSHPCIQSHACTSQPSCTKTA